MTTANVQTATIKKNIPYTMYYNALTVIHREQSTQIGTSFPEYMNKMHKMKCLTGAIAILVLVIILIKTTTTSFLV